MRKTIWIILAVALILSVSSCGGGKVDPSDPNQGLWVAAEGEMWGMDFDIEEMFDTGFTIELLDKGKCTIIIDGKKSNGKWTLENGAFTIRGGGLNNSGRLENGRLNVDNILGIGLDVVFLKDATSSSARPSSGGSIPAAIAGKYSVFAMEVDGTEYDIDDMIEAGLGIDGYHLTLNGGGDFLCVLDGQNYEGTFTFNNNAIRLMFDGDPNDYIDASLAGNVVTMDNGDTIMHFKKN